MNRQITRGIIRIQAIADPTAALRRPNFFFWKRITEEAQIVSEMFV